MRKNTEDFVNKARQVHGGFYDYTMVDYKNCNDKVEIICPIHGHFMQSPAHHLRGHGCARCRDERAKKKVYDVGINDSKTPVKQNGKHTQSYSCWKRMLERCYSDKWHNKYPTYIRCYVCEEWKVFSNFEVWFKAHFHEGYDLDKDILVQGNKMYSPSTCCFIPHRINSLLGNCAASRGEYKVGVYWKKRAGKFVAQMQQNGKYKTLGYFDSEEDAYNAYKSAKREEIKRVANEYYSNNAISAEIRDALLRYVIPEY